MTWCYSLEEAGTVHPEYWEYHQDGRSPNVALLHLLWVLQCILGTADPLACSQLCQQKI